MHITRAIVLRKADLGALGTVPAIRIVLLPQDMCMVFVCAEMLNHLRAGQESGESQSGFEYLDEYMLNWLLGISRRAAVTYLETEYSGGVGAQGAIVLDGGKIVFGPAFNKTLHPTDVFISQISLALKFMGVDKGGHIDEFDALGLGQYRDMPQDGE